MRSTRYSNENSIIKQFVFIVLRFNKEKNYYYIPDSDNRSGYRINSQITKIVNVNENTFIFYNDNGPIKKFSINKNGNYKISIIKK